MKLDGSIAVAELRLAQVCQAAELNRSLVGICKCVRLRQSDRHQGVPVPSSLAQPTHLSERWDEPRIEGERLLVLFERLLRSAESLFEKLAQLNVRDNPLTYVGETIQAACGQLRRRRA